MKEEFFTKLPPVIDETFIRKINSMNREPGEWDRQPCHEYLLVNKLMKTGKYTMYDLNVKSYNDLQELIKENNIK